MRIKRIISNLNLYLYGYLKSLKSEKQTLPRQPIDFVITWVDGSDEEWLKAKTMYTDNMNEKDQRENSSVRFRDWSIFKYWFRAVEQYAPWVRKVYFVTWGHVPAWLDTSCEKLVIVKHTDFIPKEYLPTFNSLTIEANLFRIKGLSENFVYFNDDIFLNKAVTPDLFFINNKPVACAVAYPLIMRECAVHEHALFNAYSLANNLFNIRKTIKQVPENGFRINMG